MIALVTTPGGYVKDATGLYYCQNRYYDPANGRWLTRDPIGYEGGINLYGYCGGGPVGAVDPWGLKLWSPYKWIYTGDGYASDVAYEAALDGAVHGFGVGIEGLKSGASFGLSDSPMRDELGFGESKWLTRLGLVSGCVAIGAAVLGTGGATAGGGISLYRVVERSEQASLVTNGGRATPSPYSQVEKPFFTASGGAQNYRGLANKSWGPFEIWKWPNPKRIGRPWEYDGIPGWNIPNEELPHLGPGFKIWP